jgi:hypothetical protein
MSTGYIGFNWLDALMLILFVGAWFALTWFNRGPSIDSLAKFVAIITSRGGQILLLSLGAAWTFHVGIGLFYHLIQLSTEGKIDEKSAIVLMSIQFVTCSAFGGCFGALLKTLPDHGDPTAPTSLSSVSTSVTEAAPAAPGSKS